MPYLNTFCFPDGDGEFDFLLTVKRKCYNTFYPFQVLPRRGLERLDFAPVTILYGGNGTGKSTVLNVIAEKAKLKRDAIYNKSNFFADYVALCQMEGSIPADSRILTSDGVFDSMLTVRSLNEGIDRRREDLFAEYLDRKYAPFRFRSLEDYEALKQVTDARRMTSSRYVRENLTANVREYSNGESAFLYFSARIEENALYLLDEPENSLSPERQKELAEYVENAVRFFDCQVVIATHSPFFLALRGGKIYDFDQTPVRVASSWTQLKNVRAYYDFFRAHQTEFE